MVPIKNYPCLMGYYPGLRKRRFYLGNNEKITLIPLRENYAPELGKMAPTKKV